MVGQQQPFPALAPRHMEQGNQLVHQLSRRGFQLVALLSHAQGEDRHHHPTKTIQNPWFGGWICTF